MIGQLERKLTWQEFRNLEFPDDDLFIYELINGELVKKATPSPLHQRVSKNLEFAFQLFLREHSIGELFHAPVDVMLDENNGCQPDILFISKERDFIVDLHEGILGAPDLIVEIISPGSIRRDRVDKKNLYERFAVREFWLIDPANRTVEIYVMQENAYALHQFLEAEGKATSKVLPDLEVEIATIF